MNVAIYTRVSTIMQVRDGHSLDAQKSKLIEYCNKNKYTYIIYEDAGKSAKNTKRESLQKMLDDINDKKIDMVLVWKLSRLSRSVRDFANMMYVFDKKHVTFFSFSEKFDTGSIMGKLLMYIISIVAELERDTISENIKLIFEQDFEKGLSVTRNILGYKSINKKLIIIKKEANIVRFIFSEYIKCKNFSEVARICTKKRYKGKNGKEFRPSCIRTILSNTTYLGYSKYLGNRQENKHASIITIADFQKCNNNLEGK